MPGYQVLMYAEDMRQALEGLGDALLQRHGSCKNLAIVGIQRRGVDIAERLGKYMENKLGHAVVKGSLDIALYRDDWTMKATGPEILETRIHFDVADKNLVLVDDVLYTGRTIRAALEALADFGRPSKVELLVLVDRGHRELPIHPDYVGLTVSTEQKDRVDVLMQDRDGIDEVRLVSC